MLADGRSLQSRTGSLGRGQLYRCTVSSFEGGHEQEFTVGSTDVMEKFRTLLQLLSLVEDNVIKAQYTSVTHRLTSSSPWVLEPGGLRQRRRA
ncbi:hypothetical protein CYMTET_7630 [Cymbomonas tetramitiformis]|uniref:Uncharacterized protein n=1 Tax=Cymbomonas tetramitiformis TaxID=36881 RepID=A0AAE0LGT8_9CHLO|nr:hypothetical protein CYMTET_7630 [Cymbomonas tetramitiformis]